MKPYMKPDEAGGNAEEHSAFPTPLEENALESASRLAVPRFLLLFPVCFLSTFCLLTLAANFPVIAKIVASF